jgi:hypothetical protein
MQKVARDVLEVDEFRRLEIWGGLLEVGLRVWCLDAPTCDDVEDELVGKMFHDVMRKFVTCGKFIEESMMFIMGSLKGNGGCDALSLECRGLLNSEVEGGRADPWTPFEPRHHLT